MHAYKCGLQFQAVPIFVIVTESLQKLGRLGSMLNRHWYTNSPRIPAMDGATARAFRLCIHILRTVDATWLLSLISLISLISRRSLHHDVKACESISRNIYIDLPAFVLLCLFASLLLHIHTLATNYLKNLFSLISFVRSYFTRPFISSFFFLDFLVGLFVQNKMASFWHWKKKYTFQRLFLS